MEGTSTTERRRVGAPDLGAYLPRLVHGWADDPRSHRALDGSMVFVDISGFTKLSERLASKGKEGAEEVTDILNERFTQLLAVAYARGGGLIKFGGDALLLFFAGPEHECRAAASAVLMRARLKELSRIETSTGPVTLRMSVGVHTGAFDFFLVGDRHRELVITGPAASETVRMESTAEAGEILASAALAATLPAKYLGPAKGDGILLRRAPDCVTDEIEPLRPTEADLGVFLPRAIRAHIERGDIDPEHRLATIAFIHFDGIDGRISANGADAVARQLQRLVSVSQRAAEENAVSFLGTDIDVDGGKIILAAGVPVATGDDEERMLRTVRAIVDAAPEIPVRVGVNSGHVFAGDVGPPYRRTYTVMGDAVNLAARLMARATEGTIVVSPSVLGASRTRYATQPMEPFLVKGKAKPVIAKLLGEALTGGFDESDTALPLVGRDAELATLERAISQAREGIGSVIEIVAPAGLGKSRLSGELRRHASMRTMTAVCEPYEASTPYFAFRWLLRTFFDIAPGLDRDVVSERIAAVLRTLAPELVPWIPLLGDALDIETLPTPESDALDPSFRRAKVRDVVSILFTRALDTPSLLVFEDVHWMDDASAEILRHVAGLAREHGWIVCVTRRPEGVAPMQSDEELNVVRVRLEPLSAAASEALVRDVARSAALPPHAAAAIAQRSGGHPLFLRELLGAARAGGDLSSLPDSVESLIAARLDALSATDRSFLRVASVLGSSFSEQMLQAFLAKGDIQASASAWNRLDEFIGLEKGGWVRFRHALFRDAAYEALPFRRRRELHRLAGELYEEKLGERASESAEALSLHFSRAQMHERAWRYSLTAGDRAKQKFANVEAAEFYRRALESARRSPSLAGPAVARVWESLGDVCEMAGLYEDAARAYRNARRLAEGAGQPTTPLLLKEGVMREREGKYADALRWYGRGLHVAERERATNHRIELALAYAGVRFRQGRMRECIRWAKSVVDDAEGLRDRPALAHAYYLIYNALTWTGDPEQDRYAGLALPIYEELGDLVGQANVLNNLGVGAYFEGRWDAALELYERSREAQERVGDVIGAATSVNNIGEILSDQGRLAEARRLFHDVYAICRGAGYPFIEYLARANLGRVAARSGEHEHAREWLGAALDGFRSIHSERYMLETQVRIAEDATFTGDADAVAHAAAEADGMAKGQSGIGAVLALLERCRAYAAALAGDRTRARSHLSSSLSHARGVNAQFEIALTLEAAGRIGEPADDMDPERATRESSEMFRTLGVVCTPDVPLN